MRLSAFNVYLDETPRPGCTLVHNTFSGGFAELDAPMLALLKQADAGGSLDEAQRARIDPELSDEAVGVVVGDRPAEERAFGEWHERQCSSAGRLSVVVSTTFACNLDCTYCCQADVLDGSTMTAGTAARTATFLAARAREIGAGEISLELVGGEPLVRPTRVEELMSALRALAGSARVRFGLITNGVLLTPELVEAWRPLGLEAAQVTLDGDETTHSLTRRSLRRGEDTFAASFAHAVGASRVIRVSVRGNYRRDTVHGFPPLLAKLAAAGLPPGSRVNFKPALSSLGAPSHAGSGSCTWAGSSPELMLELSDEIRRAGFDPGDPMVLGPCAFHERHHLAVDPAGHVYKCPGFFGHPEFAVGHVATGLDERYERQVAADPMRACGGCAYRPCCGGGCIAAAWLAAGRAEGTSCEREFFEGQKAGLLRRKHALALAAAG